MLKYHEVPALKKQNFIDNFIYLIIQIVKITKNIKSAQKPEPTTI